MDELSVLREVRADTPPPTDEALHAARARLTDAMAPSATASVAPVRLLPRRRIITAALSAAAVAAGAIVLTTTGRTHPSTPPPQAIGTPRSATTVAPKPILVDAAMLLKQAARRSIAAGDPPLAPGQYRHVVTHAWESASIGGDSTDKIMPIPSNGRVQPAPQATTREIDYRTETQYELWMPRHGQGRWYWRYVRNISTQFNSDADRQYFIAHFGGIPKRSVELYSGHDGQNTDMLTPGQPDHGDQSDAIPTSWGVPTPSFLAALPRDPDALLHRLFHDVNKEDPNPADRYDNAFYRIGLVLSSGIVPADLRAALYEVAATKIPGVHIVDSAVTMDGRHGVAVGREQNGPLQGGHLRQDIIFDAAGGQYIGEREVVTRSGGIYPQPAGSVVESTAVRVDVASKPGFAD